jgi:Integrase zinc binding domain
VESNCLFYGSRNLVPKTLQSQVLQILQAGYFGIERMKHLARSAVYWPGLDDKLTVLARTCQTCAKHAIDPT